MRLQPTIAKRCAGAFLAIAMAALFAACSGSESESKSESGSGEQGGVAPSAGRGIADVPPQPATAPDGTASATPAATAAEPPDTDAPSAASDTPEGATVGGDGSDIMLAPLSSADIDGAALTGELGCSFTIDDAPPLLVAMGDVASKQPSRGVVKVGNYVEVVTAPGGFDAMLEGALFSGAGKTVRITSTGIATGTGESPPVPATLTYHRADGARRSFAGQWTCGP